MTPRIAPVAAASAIGVASALACATIIHGSSQQIGVSSQPTGAAVTVDGKPAGTTPITTKLSRKDIHRITLTLDGYQPFDMVTTRKTSGWVWGNIVFGGLIGLAVDAISGGLYDVRPEVVSAQLAKAGATGTVRADHLYVILVRDPDPAWRRIGRLDPLPAR
jgi:PEGA domain